ncbi:hypothetical protein HV824_18885 [Myxococcus sp. AM009]|uniref:hypothetical protein n=1 Tax=unclassified Myxococcus TaxID=2648731 RepID=UPI0015954B1E|nr:MULTISPECIES: hypothetical protein [unclassified Myxococcus]NVJ00176.1 hypothetical protein [Myxococcus sp. AM009]NVJ19025.1 hypothetical protein [Myxococcus sp. AM010]
MAVNAWRKGLPGLVLATVLVVAALVYALRQDAEPVTPEVPAVVQTAATPVAPQAVARTPPPPPRATPPPLDLTRPPEEVPDDNAPKVHPVDLQVIRAKLPDNLYWRMGAPTQDPAELERREGESRRWNELYGKVLSADATVEQIREYYGHRRQVSEDFITFSTEVLTRFGDVLPERDRGLYELSINMHRTRLAELPGQEQDALDRREAQERRREAWRQGQQSP